MVRSASQGEIIMLMQKLKYIANKLVKSSEVKNQQNYSK